MPEGNLRELTEDEIADLRRVADDPVVGDIAQQMLDSLRENGELPEQQDDE